MLPDLREPWAAIEILLFYLPSSTVTSAHILGDVLVTKTQGKVQADCPGVPHAVWGRHGQRSVRELPGTGWAGGVPSQGHLPPRTPNSLHGASFCLFTLPLWLICLSPPPQMTFQTLLKPVISLSGAPEVMALGLCPTYTPPSPATTCHNLPLRALRFPNGRNCCIHVSIFQKRRKGNLSFVNNCGKAAAFLVFYVVRDFSPYHALCPLRQG